MIQYNNRPSNEGVNGVKKLNQPENDWKQSKQRTNQRRNCCWWTKNAIPQH